MTATRTLQGRILTPAGWVRGDIEFDQRVRRIHATHDSVSAAVDGDSGDDVLILPGFIDLHVHGGGGARHHGRRRRRAHGRARCMREHGTTALLGHHHDRAADDIDLALRGAGAALPTRARRGAARVLGVHLEGPYINPGKLGAQPRLRAAGVAGRGAATARAGADPR